MGPRGSGAPSSPHLGAQRHCAKRARGRRGHRPYVQTASPSALFPRGHALTPPQSRHSSPVPPERPAARNEEDDELLGGGADSRPLLARCVTWNASGSRVIVGYGRTDDAGWSTSRGAVAAWCPSSPSFFPSEPEFSATTSVRSPASGASRRRHAHSPPNHHPFLSFRSPPCSASLGTRSIRRWRRGAPFPGRLWSGTWLTQALAPSPPPSATTRTASPSSGCGRWSHRPAPAHLAPPGRVGLRQHAPRLPGRIRRRRRTLPPVVSGQRAADAAPRVRFDPPPPPSLPRPRTVAQ